MVLFLLIAIWQKVNKPCSNLKISLLKIRASSQLKPESKGAANFRFNWMNIFTL